MATYKTDFSEYTDDVQPSDWTERWHTGDGSATTKAGTAADNIGSKYLQVESNGQRYIATWDDIDVDANRDNCEVLFRFTQDSFSTTTDTGTRAFVRGSGSDTTENGYGVSVFETDELIISKFVSAAATNLSVTQLGVGYFVAGDYYWIRFRVNGTSLKVKVWKDAEEEPSVWTSEVTDSAVSGVGWAGVGAEDTDPISEVDFFSAGTNGDTAPFPDVDTSVEIRNTQHFTEVLGANDDPEVRVTQHYVEVLGIRAPAGGGGSAQLIIAT